MAIYPHPQAIFSRPGLPSLPCYTTLPLVTDHFNDLPLVGDEWLWSLDHCYTCCWTPAEMLLVLFHLRLCPPGLEGRPCPRSPASSTPNPSPAQLAWLTPTVIARPFVSLAGWRRHNTCPVASMHPLDAVKHSTVCLSSVQHAFFGLSWSQHSARRWCLYAIAH